MKLVKIVDFNL